MGVYVKGNPKEGEYKLIKTTDGFVLDGKDIAYACVEIDLVRCGECKYYEESEYIEGDMACKYHIGHTYYTEADRFCYYGERNSKNNSNQI